MMFIHSCEECRFKGDDLEFTHKILSAQYQTKTDTFIIFSQVKCPNCNFLVTVARESFPADLKRLEGK